LRRPTFRHGVLQDSLVQACKGIFGRGEIYRITVFHPVSHPCPPFPPCPPCDVPFRNLARKSL